MDGADGSVGCRVHEAASAGTLPRLSGEGVVEMATRTILRMSNLAIVRGPPGASMYGPTDYYTNLEAAHKRAHTIHLREGEPTVRAHDRPRSLPPPGQPVCRSVRIRPAWLTGSLPETDRAAGSSLFASPGVLQVSRAQIHIPRTDARRADLAPFNAALVRNDKPWVISNQILPARDDYRLVSFTFEAGYADYVMGPGGPGLFLETHAFAQTMTPRDPSCGGFVVLGRWEGKGDGSRLSMIAVPIPYGWTLIVKPGCIHGDATLSGRYLMAMTTDHTSMGTTAT